jgi:integrase
MSTSDHIYPLLLLGVEECHVNLTQLLGMLALATGGGLLLSEPLIGQDLLTEWAGDSVAPLRLVCAVAIVLGAVAKLRLQDYQQDGNQWWFRFDEKGGKARTIPARHDVQTSIAAYLAAAGMAEEPGDAPLFRSAVRKTKVLTDRAMTANDIYRMVKRVLSETAPT